MKKPKGYEPLLCAPLSKKAQNILKSNYNILGRFIEHSMPFMLCVYIIGFVIFLRYEIDFDRIFLWNLWWLTMICYIGKHKYVSKVLNELGTIYANDRQTRPKSCGN